MTISKREQALILLLLYIAIVVGGYVLLINPLMKSSKEKEEQYDIVKLEKQDKDFIISQIPQLEENIMTSARKASDLKEHYFPLTENPELHIDTIYQLQAQAGVKIRDLRLDKAYIPKSDQKEAVKVDGSTDKYEIVSKEAQRDIRTTTYVILTQEGGLSNILDFVDRLNKLEKTIEISDVSISYDDEKKVYSVDYTLVFVSVI